MNLQEGKFYKYKGNVQYNQSNFFILDCVYKLMSYSKEGNQYMLIFEDARGVKGGFICSNPENHFIASGVQEVNWHNNEAKKIAKIGSSKKISPFVVGESYKYIGLPFKSFNYGNIYKCAHNYDDTIVFTNNKGKETFISLEGALIAFAPIDDRVEHPKHYTWLKDVCGIEVIDITRHLNFNIGNAIKYLLRKDKEDIISLKEKRVEDLKKAKWYINDEIEKLENVK